MSERPYIICHLGIFRVNDFSIFIDLEFIISGEVSYPAGPAVSTTRYLPGVSESKLARPFSFVVWLSIG